ncbi:hypothetical protein MPRF_19640 [Mycolicibacterium parafortuitum]|uniref:Uncharacterized protein n=1 Tax=Mycolicibacterium parafortuitum TaxID=39692 RepID=A0A7I7U294_MYCPF|nr:hypothetical protein MPRF_19640 [Mycolicibacterium parafortuitum]
MSSAWAGTGIARKCQCGVLGINADLWTADSDVAENTVPLPIREEATIRLAKTPHKRDDPRQGGRRRRSSCISPGGSG